MDKLAVNNQIILMRKPVKNARRATIQRLNSQIKKLETRISKSAKRNPEKIDDKLQLKKEKKTLEIAAVKRVSADDVSKHALERVEPWKEIINRGDVDAEQKAIAKIASHAVIQKAVDKFRSEHSDWNLWLPTLLQLWHEKRAIKNKKSKTNEEEDLPNTAESNPVSLLPSSAGETKLVLKKDEIKTIVPRSKSISIKKIQLDNIRTKEIILADEESEKEDENVEEDDMKEEDSTQKVPENKEESKQRLSHKKDSFFLGGESDSAEDEDNEDNSRNDDNNERSTHRDDRGRNSRFSKRYPDKHPNFSRPQMPRRRFNEAPDQFQRNPNLIPIAPSRSKMLPQNVPPKEEAIKKHHEKHHEKQHEATSFEPPSIDSNKSNLHPSWEAKRKAKQQHVIRIDAAPMGKRIKFDD